jgi:PadR family transcriptional regulator PadR
LSIQYSKIQSFIKPLTPSIARYMIASMIGEALKGHLDLLLLAILADGPAHGYAVIESLRHRSGGTFDLPEGTIYPALHRLENQGLLRSNWLEDSPRRKRIYQLTPKGQQMLARRQEEWKMFSKAINATVGI